jgi:hypothetical protein
VVIKGENPISQIEKWGLGIQLMATSLFWLANGVSEILQYFGFWYQI